MRKVSFKTNLPKTIYNDIVGMPDPLFLGFTIHYYNYSSQTLYMQLRIEGAGWSANTKNLGDLAAGGHSYVNWDNASTRARPPAAISDYVSISVIGYSDAGYSNEVGRYTRTVTIVFIKSDDGSWTINESDDFDDGTVQGWAVRKTQGQFNPSIAVVTDYVLSSPKSIKMSQQGNEGASPTLATSELYKEFTTPNKNSVFAILNVRSDNSGSIILQKSLTIKEDDTIIMRIGVGGVPYTHFFPLKKWMRFVIPLTRNTTLEIRVAQQNSMHGWIHKYVWVWFDDFKIISKD